MDEAHPTTEARPATERVPRSSPVDRRGPEPMSPEHRAAVAEAREQIRHGETASDEEVDAAFRSFEL